MSEPFGRPPARWMWALSLALGVLAGTGAGFFFIEASGGDATSAIGGWMLTAAGAIAVAGLFRVPTNSGNALTPAYIAIAALPLLVEGDGTGEPIFGRSSYLAAMLGGLTILWLVRTANGHDPRIVMDRMVRRFTVFTVYLVIFETVSEIDLLVGSEWRRLAMFSLAAAGSFLVEAFVHVLLTGRLVRGRFRHGLASSLTDAPVFLSLLSSGALFGLAYENIGPWALAIAVLPYAFTAGAFRRLDQTRRTYHQTLRALARIPEVGGHTEQGHAARTNDLAMALAERIGVSPHESEQINYASFLHDIGRITLNEPSILRQGFTDVDLARWGAEIIGETQYLSDVAEIVRRQHEPFRSPGEFSNPDLPLASRIIKVCSAYDESVSEMGFSPLEALERIHRGTVYDFDPDVVRELRAVLERRGALNHPSGLGSR